MANIQPSTSPSTPSQGGQISLYKELNTTGWKWKTTLLNNPLPWKATAEQRTPLWYLCTAVNFTVIPLLLVLLAEVAVNATIWLTNHTFIPLANKVITWLNKPPAPPPAPPPVQEDKRVSENQTPPVLQEPKTPEIPPKDRLGEDTDVEGGSDGDDENESVTSEGRPFPSGSPEQCVEGDMVNVPPPLRGERGNRLPGPIVGGRAERIAPPPSREGVDPSQYAPDRDLDESYINLGPL